MPAFGNTGLPPDPNTWSGRGWAPERTWLTPRTDGARDTSAKAAPRSAAPQQQTALKALGPPPGVDVRTMVQPGLDSSSLRSVYEKTLAPGAPFRPPLPGPPTLGEGLAHRGFDPSRGAVGRQFGHSKEFSTKEPPPAPPPMPSQSQAPWMMNGRVVAGGRPPKVPEHHVKGYESPDRALIGSEEVTATAAAMRRRMGADQRPGQK